jgi:hypothetical protein
MMLARDDLLGVRRWDIGKHLLLEIRERHHSTAQPVEPGSELCIPVRRRVGSVIRRVEPPEDTLVYSL